MATTVPDPDSRTGSAAFRAVRLIHEAFAAEQGEPGALEEILGRISQMEEDAFGEGGDTNSLVGTMLTAARHTFRGEYRVAREHLLLLAGGSVSVPILQYMAVRLVRRDRNLFGDAHDLGLRFAQTTMRERVADGVAALAYFDDALISASLIDNVPRPYSVIVLAWRSWTLISLGQYEDAADGLIESLTDVRPEDLIGQWDRLETHMAAIADHDAASAERLLDLLLRKFTPEIADIPNWLARVLLRLLDKCENADHAVRLVQIIDGPDDDRTSASHFLVNLALDLDCRRAAAVLAAAEYRASGDVLSAYTAAWQLAWLGRREEAARIGREVNWAETPQLDRDSQILLMQWLSRHAPTEDDLLHFEHQLERLGASVEEDFRVTVREAKRAEWVDLRWLGITNGLLDRGETSKSLRMANKFVTVDRLGVAPLGLHVDLLIESGRFAEALELAQSLYDDWPAHPIALLKLATVYMWLSRDREVDDLVRTALPLTRGYPHVATPLIRAFRRASHLEAIVWCDRLLGDATYSVAHADLRTVRNEIRSAASADE